VLETLAAPASLVKRLGYAASVSSDGLPRRVILLDFDGVVAPITRWDRYGDLEPSCIQMLSEIAARGGADVVVSSIWRYGKTVGEAVNVQAVEAVRQHPDNFVSSDTSISRAPIASRIE
jgi:HAD domain in Swiss Army Knife RNA repair proteins